MPSKGLDEIKISTLGVLVSNCLATSKCPLCGGLNLPGYSAVGCLNSFIDIDKGGRSWGFNIIALSPNRK